MKTIFWQNEVNVQLSWRPSDESPNKLDLDLYLNNLYVGYVFIGRNDRWGSYSFTKPFIVDCITYFPTEQEAKDHLVDTVLKGLTNVSN